MAVRESTQIKLVALVDLRAASSHVTAFKGNATWCKVCLRRGGGLQVKDWLRRQAVRIGGALNVRPQLVDSGALSICKGAAHASHQVWVYKGTHWCGFSGAWARVRARRLLRPCRQWPTCTGARGLKRLARGLPLVRLKDWPVWRRGVACLVGVSHARRLESPSLFFEG